MSVTSLLADTFADNAIFYRPVRIDDQQPIIPANEPRGTKTIQGLESFREETRDYFFGREAEIAELYLRLRSQPLLVLYGRSAGVIPRLRREGHRAAIHRLSYGQEDPSPLDQLLFDLGVRDSLSEMREDPIAQWEASDRVADAIRQVAT